MSVGSEFEGGCSCGNLRYRISSNPLIVHACHCRQCQRVTGSAFVMNALIEKSEVTIICGSTAHCRFPDTQYCGTGYMVTLRVPARRFLRGRRQRRNIGHLTYASPGHFTGNSYSTIKLRLDHLRKPARGYSSRTGSLQ